MQRALFLVLSLGSILAGAACSVPLTLTVELRTDLVPGIEFTTVRTISASSFEPGVPPSGHTVDHPVALGDATATGVQVAAFDSVPLGQSYVILELLDATGTVVAERPTAVTVSSNTTLTVVVTRDCRGVTCPRAGDPSNAAACFGGRCVDPSCASGTCGTPTCTADSDCTGGSACTVPSCVHGACFYAGGSCAADEYCDPGSGCQPVSGPHDAGASDAGASDAGPTDAGALDAGPTDGALDAGPTDAGAIVDATSAG